MQGEEKVSKAIVYVDNVNPGDVLYLGTLSDSGLDLDDPLKNATAWRVERLDSIPNLRNTETFNKAYL